jgi:hypothetical protein
MSNKVNYVIAVLTLIIIGLCTLCLIPTATPILERRQTLRNDLSALNDLARNLGDNGEFRFYTYRAFDWNGVDYLSVAFLTPLSCDQVLETLAQAGFVPRDKPNQIGPPQESPHFLEEDINRYNEKNLITYNHYYKSEDFISQKMSAPVRYGRAYIDQNDEELSIGCGGLNNPDDRWFINDVPLSGSVVRIVHHRWFDSDSTFTLDIENWGIVKDRNFIRTPTPPSKPGP